MKSAAPAPPLVPGATLPALTGVRFVAAFAVVLCHFGPHLFAWGPQALVRLLASMFNAVGFFFMLSGFILAHTYGDRFLTGRASPVRFYRARFARLYPAYVLALLIAFPDFFVTVAGRSWGRVAEWSAVKLLMVQSWLPTTVYATGWNTPTWSISTEIFFYLVFPFLAGPLLRLRARTAVGLFVGGTVLVSALALLADTVLVPSAGPALQIFLTVSPLARVFDFAVGIVVYRIATDGASSAGSSPSDSASPTMSPSIPAIFDPGDLAASTRTALWIGLGILATALLATNLVVAKSQGLCYPMFALVLLLLARGRDRVTAWLSSPGLVRLGEESYALYLVHTAVGAIALRIWTRLGHAPDVSRIGSLTYALATILVSLALARLVHRYVETPGRRWLLGERGARPAPRPNAPPNA